MAHMLLSAFKLERASLSTRGSEKRLKTSTMNETVAPA